MNKLQPPIKNFSFARNVSQMFGVNKSLYKKQFGIPGHNALDLYVSDSKLGYGTPIYAMHDGVVERIVYDVPHQTRGNGIYLLSTDNSYSTVYWHLANFSVQVGQKITVGDLLGSMGNSGYVMPRPNHLSPHLGTHLHAGLKIHGLSNEYGGFVDPTPYLFDTESVDKLPVRFNRNLQYGDTGDDVAWLQTILHIEGFGGDYSVYGIFGRKTLRDVIKLQRKYKIEPSWGFVWPKTRRYINSRYSK